MQDREKLFPIIRTFSGSSVLSEPLQTNDNADSRAMPQILVFNAFTVMVFRCFQITSWSAAFHIKASSEYYAKS